MSCKHCFVSSEIGLNSFFIISSIPKFNLAFCYRAFFCCVEKRMFLGARVTSNEQKIIDGKFTNLSGGFTVKTGIFSLKTRKK